MAVPPALWWRAGNATVFNFSAPAVGGSLSASSCSTVAGACSVTLTATVAGSYAITASTGGSALGGSNPVSAVFVAGSPTAGGSRVTLSAGPKTANGTDAYTITASAYDSQGNLNTGSATVFNFTAPGVGASLSASSCSTTAGVCSVTLSATVAGSYAVTASTGGVPVGGSNPVTGVFVAGLPAAANSRVAISTGPKLANGVDSYTITASAYDAQGNLSSFNGTTFSFSVPGAGAALSAAECVTALTGSAAGTCSVMLTATVAGSYAVSADLAGEVLGGTNPVTGVFVAGTATAGSSRVVISAGPKTANGTDAYTITASAYDSQGNLNTGSATVFNFTAPGVGASLSASSCSTTAGVCSVTLSATVAGSYAVGQHRRGAGGRQQPGHRGVRGGAAGGGQFKGGHQHGPQVGQWGGQLRDHGHGLRRPGQPEQLQRRRLQRCRMCDRSHRPHFGHLLGHVDGDCGRQLCGERRPGGRGLGRDQPGDGGVCGRHSHGGQLAGGDQRRPQDGQRYRRLHDHGQCLRQPGQPQHGQCQYLQLQRAWRGSPPECQQLHDHGRHLLGDLDGHHGGQLRRDHHPGRCQRRGHQPGHGGVRGFGPGCGPVAGEHHPDRCDQDSQRCGLVHHHRNGL